MDIIYFMSIITYNSLFQYLFYITIINTDFGLKTNFYLNLSAKKIYFVSDPKYSEIKIYIFLLYHIQQMFI